jgi:hypothetical protein
MSRITELAYHIIVSIIRSSSIKVQLVNNQPVYNQSVEKVATHEVVYLMHYPIFNELELLGLLITEIYMSVRSLNLINPKISVGVDLCVYPVQCAAIIHC